MHESGVVMMVVSATSRDLRALVQMRMKLQRVLSKAHPVLWPVTTRTQARFLKFYRACLVDPRARMVVVRPAPGKPFIGMALGRVLDRRPSTPRWLGRIDDVWVDPGYRRRGLTRRMVRELLVFFRSKKAGLAMLDYAVQNEVSVKVWTRLGFSPSYSTSVVPLSRAERAVR